MKRDKIGMWYESLHIMDLLSVQYLQVNNVIVTCCVVLVGVALSSCFVVL